MKLAKAIFFYIFLTVLSPTDGYAFFMSNNNYILQTNNLSTNPDQQPYKTTGISKTQTNSESSGTNFTIKTGFDDIPKPQGPFTISLSHPIIDFGILSATNPILRTSIILVINSMPTAYTIIAYEDHPLQTDSGAFIPDTTCDNGSCNARNEANWNQILTYGFGYRCDSINGQPTCPQEFTNPLSFKQFSVFSALGKPEVVFKNNLSAADKIIQITYKTNISSTQQKGLYANHISFIAIPSY